MDYKVRQLLDSIAVRYGAAKWELVSAEKAFNSRELGINARPDAVI